MLNRVLCFAALMFLVTALSGCMVTKSAYDQKEEKRICSPSPPPTSSAGTRSCSRRMRT